MNLTEHPLYKELRANGVCCEDAMIDTAGAVIMELQAKLETATALLREAMQVAPRDRIEGTILDSIDAALAKGEK